MSQTEKLKNIEIEAHLSRSAQSIIAMVPSAAHVPYGPSREVRLVWRAVGGATFPENAIRWEGVRKTRRQVASNGGTKLVQCGAAWRPAVANKAGATVIKSEVYQNGCLALVNWPYTIQIRNGNATVTIDPEVANDPPG